MRLRRDQNDMENIELEIMVEDILKREEKLNEWERYFMDDISCIKHFSPKQVEVINKIWDRVT